MSTSSGQSRVQRVLSHLSPAATYAENTDPNRAGIHGGAESEADGIIKSMCTLKGKTVLVTGASRGIGLAIALRAAKDGANVVIAAKTATPQPNLKGTIFTAAKEIEEAGGRALPIVCDIRSEDNVRACIAKAVETFGGIDVVVNNASAINLKNVKLQSMKRFDLMHQVNARGTYMVTALALPYLKESAKKGRNPHVLTLSPPLNMEERWFAPHTAYTMAKFGMSMCVLGMSGEFRDYGIGVNALWPRFTIATAAVKNLLGGKSMMSRSRTPQVMGDAAHLILTSDSKTCTGNFFVEDKVLLASGKKDLAEYAATSGMPDSKLMPDFFV